MRLLIQRVSQASVTVDGTVTGSIDQGLLVFMGVHKEDKPEDTEWLVKKLLNLRIFSDPNDKMNLSVQDIKGGLLVVSQFTLYANCANGRRPDFIDSAPPALAETFYEKFVEELRVQYQPVETGVFAAKMAVELINDGPVTIILENKKN